MTATRGEPAAAAGKPLELDAHALLDGLGDAVIVGDGAGRIAYANDQALHLFRTTRADLVGAPVSVLVPQRLRAQHVAGIARFFSTGEARLIGGPAVRLPALRADGEEVEVELILRSHETSAGEPLVVATLRDLSDRVELERQRDIARYLAMSREITARLAFGAEVGSLVEAAPILLSSLASSLGWDGGALWQLTGDRLEPMAQWSAASDDLALTMTSGTSFAIGEGLPGTVHAERQAAWIETVATSSVFTRQNRARAAGVRSCFAFPIVVDERVEGVVEMYSRAVQPPEPELLAILQSAGQEIGRLLERAQTRRHMIELAEALQASLLPPAPPMVPGLDIAVRYRAAAGEGQIGGDFFDVFPLPDGEWAVLIGDVAGRGPRAAALTALARYTLRAAAMGTASPSAVLRLLNDVVRRELQSSDEGDERFLTAAYLTVGPSAEGFTLKVACGGHPVPLARRLDGRVEDVPCAGDLIGAFDAHEASDETVELRPGELVVLVTDGVVEARANGQEFGSDKLRDVIAASGGGASIELADAIEKAVLDHLGGRSQDDLAVVVLRLPPGQPTSDASIDVRVGELVD